MLSFFIVTAKMTPDALCIGTGSLMRRLAAEPQGLCIAQGLLRKACAVFTGRLQVHHAR